MRHRQSLEHRRARRRDEPAPWCLEDRRALWNREAQARLTAAGEDVLPAAVLTHALRSRWIPRTFRAAVDGYWRAHPLRAERLARGLASRSGTPAGWRWRLGPLDDLPATFRIPPLPFRERAPPAPVSASSAASRSSGLAGTESGKAPAPQISAQPGMHSRGLCHPKLALVDRPVSSRDQFPGYFVVDEANLLKRLQRPQCSVCGGGAKGASALVVRREAPPRSNPSGAEKPPE